MALEIHFVPIYKDNYVYVLHVPGSQEVAAIDPGEAAPVQAFLDQQGWRLTEILVTHHHWDHVTGLPALKEVTGARVTGFEGDARRIPGIDRTVKDGDILHCWGVELQVTHIPGHTLGHIMYYIPQAQALFCGDTLFSLGCGKLFEGTPAQLVESLQKIASLPPDTRIYCTHEYTLANGLFARWMEPENEALKAWITEAKQRHRQGRPTLPSLLSTELAANPFLRLEVPEVRRKLGRENAPTAEVMAMLRYAKEHFR
ncbi:MAG: hydroxyacylglutathione hydrolase [Hyphomicrobiales bacterium]|nr:hydroxyacylglutathione hydrolase [Hyphomicrobiales bacterium]